MSPCGIVVKSHSCLLLAKFEGYFYEDMAKRNDANELRWRPTPNLKAKLDVFYRIFFRKHFCHFLEEESIF